jgi:2,3-bisphosphoglycerate-dependent phosphoglycerate mutase
MRKLILLRHGQSLYNKENLFTGWTDVELSEEGKKEAVNAGKKLREAGLYPDICFTSWLKRAIHTAQLSLQTMEWEHIDCIKSWKLNERNYGAWQQRDKDAVEKEAGKEKFLAVRRGFSTPPPPLNAADERAPKFDKKYQNIDANLLPLSESLEDTKKRVMPYFFEEIVPQILDKKTVLVSAHGNSLRALVMHLDNISEDAIGELEIATGVLIVYEFDDTMQVVNKTFLSS